MPATQQIAVLLLVFPAMLALAFWLDDRLSSRGKAQPSET